MVVDTNQGLDRLRVGGQFSLYYKRPCTQLPTAWVRLFTVTFVNTLNAKYTISQVASYAIEFKLYLPKLKHDRDDYTWCMCGFSNGRRFC